MLQKALSLLALLAPAAWAGVSAVSVGAPAPMPVLRGAAANPIGYIELTTDGADADVPDKVVLKLPKPDTVSAVSICYGSDDALGFGEPLGTAKAGGTVTIPCRSNKDMDVPKKPTSHNKLWILAEPSKKAAVGSTIKVKPVSVTVNRKEWKLEEPETLSQPVGVMVAVPGQKVGTRDCKAFRIPGMIRTAKGTLIAVFDARYNSEGDLCADIDVVAVTSKDGGKTWTQPTVAMDSGEGAANGNGDPCIVQSAKGKIWLQSLVCHFSGGASIGKSQTGFAENSTGQWEFVTSDNEGKSWSKKHINVTKDVKKEDWNLVLAGPGCGIVTKEGVIVLPAQWWRTGGKRESHSTIVYSKDNGRKWSVGEGVIPGATSECQVVELSDGSLMLNCRNEQRSGKRIVYITKDFGATWEPHETNNAALQEPTCQASIVRLDVPGKGEMLFFSNPKSGSRDHMTIRYSTDDGKTWSDGYEYESRRGMGYSCLALADDKALGVVYETPQSNPATGARGIGFLRIPIARVLGEETEEKADKKADKAPKEAS